MTTFETAKIGDKVWSSIYGWGEITYITPQTYPIGVTFEKIEGLTYTAEGVSLKGQRQSLFWDEIKFEIPHKPLPQLEVDTKVLVWADGCEDDKQRRHFSHFSDGKMYCFDSGLTSWTTKGTANGISVWYYWELAE